MFKHIMSYIYQYKWWYIIGSIMVILKTIVSSILPKYVQEAIDYLKTDFLKEKVIDYVLIIITISIVQGIFLYAMRRIMIGASRHIENDLRNEFFAKLQSLDVNFFHHNRTGDLMSRSTSDLGNIRSIYGPAVMYTINLVFSFIVYLYMMIKISPWLTLWAVMPIPLMGICVYYLGQIIHKKQSSIQVLYGNISTFAQENLAGNRVVKSFAIEKDQIKKFSELNSDYYIKMVNFLTVNNLFFPAIYLIISLGIAAIIYFGGLLVINNELTIGELTAFILYLGLLTWPSIAVGWVVGLYQSGTASFKRILEIMNTPSLIINQIDEKEFKLKGKIEFKDLSFTYPNSNQLILNKISFTLEAGQTLGITGNVGSGKTTLINLINRTYQVEDGKLFFDDIDINKITPVSLNNQIAFVPQESFLFSSTIEENILFWENSNVLDLDKIIEKAQLSETLKELKDGKETLLGERGINLSGGQKQRVAIARALIKNAPILILDDCLSAVDTFTEAQILSAFKAEKRTVLIVSHRITSIQHADHIILLDEGKIVEEGTHTDLLKKKGHYARLNEKQLIEEELNK